MSAPDAGDELEALVARVETHRDDSLVQWFIDRRIVPFGLVRVPITTEYVDLFCNPLESAFC